MKSISITLFFAILGVFLHAQTCLPNGIIFDAQSKIDQFSIDYPGCSQILGNVVIGDTMLNSTIKNLVGLSALKVIDGNLEINGNIKLKTLDGLSNLTQVGRNLVIYANATLKNLEALSALKSVGLTLELSYNDSLSNLYGLSALTHAGGITISSNTHFSSFAGLTSLDTIQGPVIINNNNSLHNLKGLDGITHIAGSLNINNNYILDSLTGISSLHSMEGDLVLYKNFKLASLDGLSALNGLNGDLVLHTNGSLTSLSGLDHINPNTIHHLYIRTCFELSTCEVESICNYLSDSTNTATITGNKTGCKKRIQIEQACSGVVGVQDISPSNIKIFPNPTTGVVEIQGQNLQDISVQMYDPLGRLILVQNLTNSNKLDLQALPSGMYLMNLFVGKELSQKWVVKE